MHTTAPITKTEAAYQILRREILSTRLAPGAPLKLAVLRASYGIGWTPLREALSRLEAERLVTAISNRGFAVAPVSRAELEDLTRARLVVELPLLREALEHGDQAWEEALVTAHHRLSRCKVAIDEPSEDSLCDWEDKHVAFHFVLLSAARSPWLLRFHANITDQLRRHHRFLEWRPALRLALTDEANQQQPRDALRDAMAIGHHTDLMHAALDRDKARAEMLMIEHIGLTLDVYGKAGSDAQLNSAIVKTTASRSKGA